MRKIHKLILVAVVTIFVFSINPLMKNNKQNIANAATTHKIRHKKAKKGVAKKKGKTKPKKKSHKKKKSTKKAKHAKKSKKYNQKKRKAKKVKKSHKKRKKDNNNIIYNGSEILMNGKLTKSVNTPTIVDADPFAENHHNGDIWIQQSVDKKSIIAIFVYSDGNWQIQHSNDDQKNNSNSQKSTITPANINNHQNNANSQMSDASQSQNNDSNSDNNSNHNTKDPSNNINYDDDNNIDDGTMDSLLMSASSEVSHEKDKGINPHISSNQSPFKQFAEFKTIIVNNEKVKRESEFQSIGHYFNDEATVPEFYSKSVSTDDEDEENSNSFNFDSNVKYIPDPFDEVKMDLKKGIMPHISSDQSPIKQFAEFQSIVENNEKQKLQSEFKDAHVDIKQDLPNHNVDLIVNDDETHPMVYHFDSSVKYIPSAFEEVKSDEIHGIKPHISSDQSPIKQFAEFEEIKLDNAKHKYLLENDEEDGDVRGIKVFRDLPNKQITIVNANDESLGNTYSFDPNAKLDY